MFETISPYVGGHVRLAFTEFTQVFTEIIETRVLDCCRWLHFICRLQTIDAGPGSATAAASAAIPIVTAADNRRLPICPP